MNAMELRAAQDNLAFFVRTGDMQKASYLRAKLISALRAMPKPRKPEKVVKQQTALKDAHVASLKARAAAKRKVAEDRVLKVMTRPMTTAQISVLCGILAKTVHTILDRLHNGGRVDRDESRPAIWTPR